MSLFEANEQRDQPLAYRMRPRSLDEFLGQRHLVGPGRLLRRAVEADRLTSSLFYGPPGTGKTSLASVVAATTRAAFVRLNAVTSGVSELREVLREASERRSLYAKQTYLLLDECHRWSKAQSDSILPAIEEGLIRFIGSTTENPLISLTPALVSRLRIFEFYPLEDADVLSALRRAMTDRERGLGQMQLQADEDALAHIVAAAGGDVRAALNALELAALTTPLENGVIRITLQAARDSVQKPVLACDETLYYDMLSAFCKSMRGSDSDAALHWFFRLLYAGADPRLLARRIIVHASEDVGLANPMALLQAMAAYDALQAVGMPEARLPLTQAVIAVSESPKSNSVVTAASLAAQDAESTSGVTVPPALRDTHYRGHSRLDSGQGYLYPHDFPGHYVRQNYMPPGFEERVYYSPGPLGEEAGRVKKKDLPDEP